MDVLTLLKLALVPIAVGLASLAARRWGHTVSGYLGGMPMVGGPIIIFLTLDHGTAFAAKVALVTLAGLLAQGAHQIAMAYVGRRFGWLPGLLSGWGAFAIVGTGLAHLDFPWWVAATYGVAALLVMWRVLPRAKDDGALGRCLASSSPFGWPRPSRSPPSSSGVRCASAPSSVACCSRCP